MRKPLTWNDVKLIPITSHQYTEGAVQGTPIENFPEYHRYALQAFSTSTSAKRTCQALAHNEARLTRHLGKRQFVFRGEFFFSGWRVDVSGTQILILTAKGKGTCYEAVIYDQQTYFDPDASKVIELMELIGNEP